MPAYIAWLKRLALGQFIREDGPQSHQKKAGTPTAGGGLLILLWLISLGLLMALFPLGRSKPINHPKQGYQNLP